MVYRAKRHGLDREVAIKLLNADSVTEAEDRFRREARINSKLNHPNIVMVHDVRRNEGRICIVMEFVEGGSLARKLDGTPRPAKEAAQLVETLARAMQFVHENGVIHRDLKPQNVLLMPTNGIPCDPSLPHLPLNYFIPKIADFGLARCLDDSRSLTETGQILGTPSYMAPEQACGKAPLEALQIGAKADVYALGAILYETITGRPPFKGQNRVATLRQVLEMDPVGPRQLQPSVPQKLETICLKCLQKKPDKRYQSALDLAEDLARFLKDDPILARPPGSIEHLAKLVRRYPATSIVSAVILLSAALVIFVLAWSYREQIEANRRLQEHDYPSFITDAYHSVSEGRMVHARQLLQACSERMRGWEWYYLKGEVERQDPVDLRLTGGQEHDPSTGYWQAAVDPNNKLIAVASIKDGPLLLDAKSGERAASQLCRPWWDPVLPVSAVAFSPDGHFLAAATNETNTIEIWDVDKRERIRVLTGHEKSLRALAFSPHHELLASGGYDEKIRVWNAKTWEQMAELPGHRGWVSSLVFNASGTVLASAGADLTVKLWDVAGGKKLLHTCNGHRSPVERVAFNPDATQLASVGLDGELWLWNALTGERLREPLLGHVGPALGVAYSPDGKRIASCGLDRTVRLWDAHSGRLLLTLNGHQEMVWSVEFAPDGGNLISAGFDATVRIWECKMEQPLSPSLPLHADQDAVVHKEEKLVNQVVFRPAGREEYLVTRWDGSVSIVDATTKAMRDLGSPGRAHDGPVWGACYSREGDRIATASWDGTVKLWQADSGQCIQQICVSVGAHAVAFGSDAGRLTIGTLDGKAGVWNTETGKRKLPLDRKEHSYFTWAVACDPRDRWIVTGGYTPGVFVWNASNGDPVTSIAAPSSNAFLLDQVALMAAPSSAPFLHDLAKEPNAHKASVFKLVFSQDGKWLASASWDKSVQLWKVPAEGTAWPTKPEWRAEHSDYVTAAAFSPDGKTLVSGGLDHEIRFWDVTSGREQGHARHLRGMVWGVTWHPSGKKVFVANWWRPRGVEEIEFPR